METLQQQLTTLVNQIENGPFSVWYETLQSSKPLLKHLYEKGKFKPTKELKDYCASVVKKRFLEQGAEVGTEGVREEMNAAYFALLEDFLFCAWYDGLTQSELDKVLSELRGVVEI
jgi:hypothetical protein